MRKRTTSMLALSALLALGAQAAPAMAATTTWKVANPNADGKYKAVASGVTVKNAAGRTLFTCTGTTFFGGVMGSRTGTSAWLGNHTSGQVGNCTAPDGRQWHGTPGVLMSSISLAGTGYNAATGTASLSHRSHNPAYPVWIWYQAGTNVTCSFFTTSVEGSYTNATSVLKTTTAKIYIPKRQDGLPNCQGLLADGETITQAAEFKFTPAIKITATTS